MNRILLSIVIVCILFVVAFTAGCDSAKPKNAIPQDVNRQAAIPQDVPAAPASKTFDEGNWTGTIYQNDFFGFSITAPSNWHISGKGEAKIIQSQLFVISRYSKEEAATRKGTSNPNILFTADKLPPQNSNMSPEELTKEYRAQIAKVPGATIKQQTNKTIGGVRFSSIMVEVVTSAGNRAQQEQLYCLKNGFILAFSLTWVNAPEKKPLDDIMATLTWQ
jgi:hypothetical protein